MLGDVGELVRQVAAGGVRKGESGLVGVPAVGSTLRRRCTFTYQHNLHHATAQKYATTRERSCRDQCRPSSESLLHCSDPQSNPACARTEGGRPEGGRREGRGEEVKEQIVQSIACIQTNNALSGLPGVIGPHPRSTRTTTRVHSIVRVMDGSW